MSLRLLHLAGRLTLLAGFEDGCASVHRLDTAGTWITTYRSRAHAQPVLSLDLHPSLECFFTSSADSIIAQHPIPTAQQSLTFPPPSATTTGPGPSRPRERLQEWEHPLKTINTRHSGQQSLKVRSDGRVFATAGWDSKIRVYSCKTLRELAVLQWHKVGAYAVSFAEVGQAKGSTAGTQSSAQWATQDSCTGTADMAVSPLVDGNAVVDTARMSVKDRRICQARSTHWVVTGAKDGKVSLWDLY